MEVTYTGARQAGCIALLTLKALGHDVVGVFPWDTMVGGLAVELGIPISSVEKKPSDLLFSVHGRGIIPRTTLDLFKYGGINIHPCLYKYKGADPVGRLLTDGGTRASVAAHRMTDDVDEGEVLGEIFVDLVCGEATVEAVYNQLYPYYSLIIIRALKEIVESDGSKS